MNKKWIILMIVIVCIIVLLAGGIIGFSIFNKLKNNKSNDNNDASKSENPIAIMDVEYIDKDGNTKTGSIKIELYKDNAPNTVKNFIRLANNGFYNDLTFHRIVKDFMIQGGDQYGNGTGSAKVSDLDKSVSKNSNEDYEYSIKGEFLANNYSNDLKYDKGVIGMARSDFSSFGFSEVGYNSGSSQFFIVNTSDQNVMKYLDGLYTAFGKVIEGYEHIDAISNIETTMSSSGFENSKPINTPIIKSITVDTKGFDCSNVEIINYDDMTSEMYSAVSKFNSEQQ